MFHGAALSADWLGIADQRRESAEQTQLETAACDVSGLAG